jgi:hypothetical protein
MKKLVTLILMTTYMACSIGFTFSFHYCGDDFRYVCFTSDTEDGCCGESEHKTNCCEDKVVTANVKDHTALAKMVLPKVFFADGIQPSNPFSYAVSCYSGHRCGVSNNSSPPLASDVPIYLMNRVLRI